MNAIGVGLIVFVVSAAGVYCRIEEPWRTDARRDGCMRILLLSALWVLAMPICMIGGLASAAFNDL